LANTISKVDLDLRKTLCSEIVLTGGTTLLQGFPERLIGEVKKLIPKESKVFGSINKRSKFGPLQRDLH